MNSPINNVDQQAVIWAIGGVDPLAVAGVLADSRAANAVNVHCATIVTCVTAQNSARFYQLEATATSLLDAQWQALLEQAQPQVIKIGLLVNPEQVQWLGQKLANYRHDANHALQVIYDPVLSSTSGNSLVNQPAIDAIKQYLLPQVDLLTPNINEAEILTGISLNESSDLVALARSLMIEFELSVLVKGGHLTEVSNAYDCYVAKLGALAPREPATSFVMASQFILNDNLRGTGCNLASLIASWLARGQTMCDALVLAKATINQAITAALPVGNNRGGLTKLMTVTDFSYLPQLMTLNQYLDQGTIANNSDFASCPIKLGLYPVVNDCQILEQLLQHGVKTVQLRAKDLNDDQVEPQVIKAIKLGQHHQARVFINDYWQLAIKHGAYGVHLGQEDLQLADLEQIKLAGLRLGLSTHGIYEAIVANQLKPSYLALGHIYPTTTKEMPSTPQGIENLAIQVKLFERQCSLVAIGGISADRVAAIVNTGIGSVAVVRAITDADDLAVTTKLLLKQVGAGDD